MNTLSILEEISTINRKLEALDKCISSYDSHSEFVYSLMSEYHCLKHHRSDLQWAYKELSKLGKVEEII